MWVRALPGPMYLGLQTGPLCPKSYTKLKEPFEFAKAPDDPHTSPKGKQELMRMMMIMMMMCIYCIG